MAILQIKGRLTGAVLFEGEYGSLKLCVKAAVSARANLAGAYLAGANLAGAYLADANLARANLAGANLADANLADANLAGANLARAYLADANLAGANLAGGLKVIALARRATRSDGYEFFLWRTDAGFRVKAGCRFFTMDEAWRHWEETRGGSPLGDESHDILTMFELHIQRVEAG